MIESYIFLVLYIIKFQTHTLHTLLLFYIEAIQGLREMITCGGKQ